MMVGLSEWRTDKGRYKYDWKFDVRRDDNDAMTLTTTFGTWARIRLTASGNSAIGSGFVSNEF